MDPTQEKAKEDEIDRKNILQTAQIHLVVATLVMTVTFTAGFTLPGGFNSNNNSPDKGKAILLRRASFRAFVVTDAIAFASSAGAVFIYFVMAASAISARELASVRRLYGIAALGQFVAMSAVVIAFITGMYSTLADSFGLTFTVCVIGCISLFTCGFLLFLEAERKNLSRRQETS